MQRTDVLYNEVRSLTDGPLLHSASRCRRLRERESLPWERRNWSRCGADSWRRACTIRSNIWQRRVVCGPLRNGVHGGFVHLYRHHLLHQVINLVLRTCVPAFNTTFIMCCGFLPLCVHQGLVRCRATESFH